VTRRSLPCIKHFFLSLVPSLQSEWEGVHPGQIVRKALLPRSDNHHQTIGPANQIIERMRPVKQARADALHTAVIDKDVVQLGIFVPRLAGAVELAGLPDSLLDLVFGLDDLQGETH